MTEAVPADFGYPPLPVDPAGPPPPRVSRPAELAVMVAVWSWSGCSASRWAGCGGDRPAHPGRPEPDGAYLTAPEAEHRIADEGWYVILTVGAGLLVAVLVWILLRSFRGPAADRGLALGALPAASSPGSSDTISGSPTPAP